MLAKAIKIAAEAFEQDFDKGGVPYIMHLLYVMHKVKPLGETAMICGVLHDLFEDKGSIYTIESMSETGFSKESMEILDLLTHKEEDSYMDYIKKLSSHPIARAIKMADLEHNTKVSRLKGLRKKDFERLEKYSIAYEYLKD